MDDLSLHVLDIVENSIRAEATRIEIRMVVDNASRQLHLYIIDNGKGMSRMTAEKSLDPFFTDKEGKRIGLGLALLAQSAQETGGKVSVDSVENQGTSVHASFCIDHVDCRPIGNMNETVRVLRGCHPQIEFIYTNNLEQQ